MSGVLGTILFFFVTWNIGVTLFCIKDGVKSYLESCDYGELIAKVVCGFPGLIVYSIYHNIRLTVKRASYIRRSLRDVVTSKEYANIH